MEFKLYRRPLWMALANGKTGKYETWNYNYDKKKWERCKNEN